MKPETVIVPLDASELSEHALGPARGLAAALDAGMLLVTARWTGTPADPDRYLADEATALAVDHVDARSFPDVDPADAIVTALRETPESVVCMATHGRSGVGRALLGSVAQAVVRQSPAPTVLVGPEVHGSPHYDEGPLLVGYDGSLLSECAVPVAIKWAEALGRPLALAAVTDDPAVLGPSEETRAAEQGLARIADRIRSEGIEVTSETLVGEARANALSDHAASLRAPLIVLTTHGRSGLSGAVMGSVAGRVVRLAGCPVVVARPDFGETELD